MHVIAVHNITHPERFGAAGGPAIEQIPASMTLHSMFPGEDGSRAVCVSEAGSIVDVRSFPAADAKAIGAPQPVAATA